MRAKITLKQLNTCIKRGLTIHEIAKKYNCKACTIYKRCDAAGISYPVLAPHHRTRQKKFDTEFFKVIDSEVKAYTLGFIAADGGLDRQWGVKIGLHPKDTDILVKIARAMKCNYKPELKENNTRIRLSFYDIDTVKDLKQYGIMERKTFTLPFALNVPVKYLNHYIRGVFDGDGSIGKQARLVTGSRRFYDEFLAWYKSTYNRLPWCAVEGNKYRMVFNKRDSDFINWLYKDATIYLDRKFKSFRCYWNKL